jgi:hypothetical protein
MDQPFHQLNNHGPWLTGSVEPRRPSAVQLQSYRRARLGRIRNYVIVHISILAHVSLP